MHDKANLQHHGVRIVKLLCQCNPGKLSAASQSGTDPSDKLTSILPIPPHSQCEAMAAFVHADGFLHGDAGGLQSDQPLSMHANH